MCIRDSYEAEPDGYNLYTTNFPAFFSCYDPEMNHTQRWDDFAYICNFCTDTNLLVTRKGFETVSYTHLPVPRSRR